MAIKKLSRGTLLYLVARVSEEEKEDTEETEEAAATPTTYGSTHESESALVDGLRFRPTQQWQTVSSAECG